MTGLKKPLTKKEAFNLLTNSESNILNNNETRYLDEHGDYVFPTDYIISTPNTAVGSSEGFDIFEIVQFEKNK